MAVRSLVQATGLMIARSWSSREPASGVPGTADIRQARRRPGPKSGPSVNRMPRVAVTRATKTTVSNMLVTGAQPVI